MTTEILDNLRKLNIHFDINALQEAYNTAVHDIVFKGELVNCISLTHTQDTEADLRGIFWTMHEQYEEIQVERPVNEDA